MNRRNFLKNATWCSLGLGLNSSVYATINSKNNNQYYLEAQQTKVNLVNNKALMTDIWSFSKDSFAMPIYAKQYEKINVVAKNNVDKTLGVHWHGIRLPNDMDGVPNLTQKPIMRGQNFNYSFTSPDAGTFWYHTHSNSVEQVSRGLVGPLIIKETEEYAVDEDVVILINDWLLDRKMQIVDNFYNMHDMAHQGRHGNLITVNGKHNPQLEFKINSRVRLRLINASNARYINPNLDTFDKVYTIAIDGHPIEPRLYRSMLLAPGMRLDLVVDITEQKQKMQISDGYFEQKSPLFHISVNNKQKQRAKILTQLPLKLKDNPIAKPELNKAQIYEINLDGGAMRRSGMMGMMKGMVSKIFWTINGKSMSEKHEYNKPILSLKKNKSYIFKIKNNTAFQHPIHLHGHTFQVLDDSIPYWTDTVNIQPNTQKSIAFVADNLGLWMFHCHILDHQVSGMMGIIEVA